jgi:hypothetical protein
MDMVTIVYPTLEHYLGIVRDMASKYGRETWLDLDPDVMEEDDRQQFLFIDKAVGGQLILREFEFPPSGRPPDWEDLEDMSIEPGSTPGSTVFGGFSVCPSICRTH